MRSRLGVLAFLAACAGPDPATGPDAGAVLAASARAGGTKCATVVVTPSTAALTSPGQTVQLSATAFNKKGNVLTGALIQWTSNAPGVAAVNATGLVTAVSPGEATVSAICNGGQASGSATITVS